MRERTGASPGTSLPRPAEACNIQAIQQPHSTRKGIPMPSEIIEYGEASFHQDWQLDLEEERYNLALKRLTVSDVLATVDDMVQSESDMRRHPLYTLAKHILRHGGFRSSGRRAHVAEQLGMVFEDLIEEAIERLVTEELASGVSWED
jgi:hypothetical protein